jgi:Zn-dependent peptidase ImmA (M78 family)
MNTSTSPTMLLATLRALAPHRPLTYTECERIAELQANCFRELLGQDEPCLDDSVIEALPRIAVRRRRGIPVSGLTHWHNGRWLIVLNADEPATRQRFSLAHEFKHVIDHSTKQWLYPNGDRRVASVKAERLADYFAACLLMPKRHVRRLHDEGGSPQDLADAFDVSGRAMAVRLSHLGLLPQRDRCLLPAARWDHFGHAYYRSDPVGDGVPA